MKSRVTELRRRLRLLEHWLDERALRERVLLAGGAFAVVAALWSLLLMDPVTARRAELEREAKEVAAELEGLEEQGQEIRRAHETDPNVALRSRADALRKQIAALDRSIQAHTVAMVSPAEMARFLEEMLAEYTDLELVRLENLEAEPLLGGSRGPDEAGAARATTAGVFKHGFEVELEGGYLSALQYLEALEALPWSFFWEGLAYEVVEYPRGRATIRAYTLSAEEEWLGV